MIPSLGTQESVYAKKKCSRLVIVGNKGCFGRCEPYKKSDIMTRVIHRHLLMQFNCKQEMHWITSLASPAASRHVGQPSFCRQERERAAQDASSVLASLRLFEDSSKLQTSFMHSESWVCSHAGGGQHSDCVIVLHRLLLEPANSSLVQPVIC